MNPKYFVRRNQWAGIFLAKPDEQTGGGSEKPKTLAEALKALEAAQAATESAQAELAENEQKVAAAEQKAEQATKDLNAAIEAGNGVRAELDTTKASLTKVTGERDAALADVKTKEARIGQLEGLCGVKGVDPNAAVAAAAESSTTKETKIAELEQKLKATTDPKEKFRLSEQLTKLRAEVNA